MRVSTLTNLVFAIPVAVLAQTADLKMGVVYQCPAVQATMEVFSCTGPAATDSCDVQTAPQGRPAMRGKSPRQQVMALLGICHLQTPAEAQGAARGGPAAVPAQAASQVGAGGFKVGDKVQVLTAGGWMDAQILRVNGNTYWVHAANGGEASKSYPDELRRIGKLTAQDHANGQYDLHDTVEVNVNGKWVPGEVSGYFNKDFDIRVAGGTVHTNVANLRPYTPPPPVQRPAGQAPKAGLASCGTKYDGRWELAAGIGGMRLVFRSGKVTVTEVLSGSEEFECWTGGGQIVLYKAGAVTTSEEPIEINNDGTLQTELGPIKKMGN